jgi:hypothetical protein
MLPCIPSITCSRCLARVGWSVSQAILLKGYVSQSYSYDSFVMICLIKYFFLAGPAPGRARSASFALSHVLREDGAHLRIFLFPRIGRW